MAVLAPSPHAPMSGSPASDDDVWKVLLAAAAAAAAQCCHSAAAQAAPSPWWNLACCCYCLALPLGVPACSKALHIAHQLLEAHGDCPSLLLDPLSALQ